MAGLPRGGARAATHAAWLALTLLFTALPSPAAGAERKLLIEMGWDEPDPAFMRRHVGQLLASPFDGCVYHVPYRTALGDSGNFTWKLWGRRRFRARDLAAARADLRATRFGRFRENFLRVNVTPGDLDWFEDHSAVMANLELAARLARESGGPGILFDIEQYEGWLWDYREQVKRHPHSWEELSAQVRERGAEAMRALERGYPGLTVFLTIGYTVTLHETVGGLHPLTVVHTGLLVPFLDGMHAAASGRVVFVDGQEHSYAYRDRAEFAAKADSMRQGVKRLIADPASYDRHRSSAFAVWLDNDWSHLGWDEHDPERNYFTPGGFGRAVQAACDFSDRYVWIYTEKPQWWSPAGGPLRMSAAYDSVLRTIRR
ncbi:MAG: hypothetical protein ABL977_04835 [Candidatus Eisenbacteria bacterium]